jgi:hypothetical protein
MVRAAVEGEIARLELALKLAGERLAPFLHDDPVEFAVGFNDPG